MTVAISPWELYPRQWGQYLQVKRLRMDEMELEDFMSQWSVTKEELALICECSIGTVYHWFTEGSSRRNPESWHKRRLAECHRELRRMHDEPPRFRQIYDQIRQRSK